MINFLIFYLTKQEKKIKVISFSSRKKADIFLLKTRRVKNCYRLKNNCQKKNFYFDTMYSTNNFINNILACISTMFILNLNLNKIKNFYRF